jgi:hypothetical protein
LSKIENMEPSGNNSGNENYKQTSEYWEKMYNEFVEFRRTKPCGLPSATIKKKPNPLYSWVIEQQMNRLHLSPLQIMKLKAAKFTWATYEIDPEWENGYIAFLKFRESHPSGMPPSEINKKHNPLYGWCNRQRKRKDMLNAGQLAKLKAACFEWETPMKLIEEAWQNYFRKFVEFKAENPNTMPSPYSNDSLLNPLYVWCNSQRHFKTRLGAKRVDRLKEAGFDFEKLEAFSPWELHYMEFITWRRKNPEGMPKKYIDGNPSSLQFWCNDQIRKRKQKKLSRIQIQKLDDAGFIWEIKDLDAAWEKKYREFVEFRKTNPTGIPPTRIDGKANPLFSWYSAQRMFRYKLSPEKINKLNAFNFDFNVYFKPDASWEKHFADFLEFKKKNPGRMPGCTNDDKPSQTLYNWCYRQIRDKDKLPADKKKRLDEAGFIWGIPAYDEKWEQVYREYVEYSSNNPGKNPPSSGTFQEAKLCRWSVRQREKKSKLSQEQIKKLDDAGFPWTLIPSKKEEVWEKWFQQYITNRTSFSDGIPPRKVNGKMSRLYLWYVRQCYDQQRLAPELIVRLNKAGFVWMTKNKMEKWEEMFEKYLDFKKNHPEGTPIPISRGKKDSLYYWCKNQRDYKSKLSAEKIKKLDEAGFNWTSIGFNEHWEQRFKEYLAFREKNPKGMPQAFLHGKANPMHNWCRTMQRFRSQLSPERIKKLNDNGFEWYFSSPNWMEYYNEYLEQKKNVWPERIQDAVPGKKSIYQWIDEQRENKDLLPPEYIQKLDEAGFEWE